MATPQIRHLPDYKYLIPQKSRFPLKEAIKMLLKGQGYFSTMSLDIPYVIKVLCPQQPYSSTEDFANEYSIITCARISDLFNFCLKILIKSVYAYTIRLVKVQEHNTLSDNRKLSEAVSYLLCLYNQFLGLHTTCKQVTCRHRKILIHFIKKSEKN